MLISSIFDFPKLSGIYKFTNKINGKVYVGESQNMRNRMSGHRSSASGIGPECGQISYALRKYGFDNFEFKVLECYPVKMAKDFLVKREKFWISIFDSTNPTRGYNKAIFHTRLEYPPVTFSPSLDQREAMRVRMAGNTHSRGLVHNEESVRKIKENMKQGHLKKIRPVYQISIATGEIIKIWDSCAHAARELIGNPHAHTNIAKVARNKFNRNYAYGFVWKFVDGVLVKNNQLKTTPILQIDSKTGETTNWRSVADAIRFFSSNGFPRAHSSTIRCALNDDKKSAYGFKWKTIDPKDAETLDLKTIPK